MCKRIVLALVVVLALGASWAQAADTGDEEYFMLQPEDTIIYDEGPILNPWPFDTLMYWAMRFTPARVCSVLAGLIWPQPPMFGGECSLFVWDNTASDLPGALVRGPIHYNLFLAPWYRIDLPSAYPDSDDFWIGYCTPLVPMIGRVFALSDTFMDYYTRNCVSWDRTSWDYCDDVILGWEGDLGIRALVRYYAIHDVGPDSINVPDTIPCDTTISPAAVVCNWGDTIETFRVDVRIDSALTPVYSDFDTVRGLAAGGCTAVVFGPWTVPHAHGFCYDLTVWTALPGDISPANDTLSKQVCLWCPALHDVGTDHVFAPPDTVACGDSVPVGAVVCNYGDTVETFDVGVVIDSSGFSVWGDTVRVADLDSAECDTAWFGPWPVPPVHGVPYTVTVTTLLGTDINPANDAAAKGALAWCPAVHDVGVDSTNVPDTIPCDTTISPAAIVCNWGDTIETFRVDVRIDSALTPVYSDFDTVRGLPAGECTAVVFGPWTVPHAHGFCYDLTVWTALPGDTNPANDTLSKQVCLWCPAVHDVGTDLVLEPPDTVACQDTVPVAARVCNYGDTVETFEVEAIIDTSGFAVYGDTVDVTALDTALCDTVIFDDWVVPDTHAVSYTVTVRTLLTDFNPGNDTARKSTVAWCPPGIEEVLTVPAAPSTYGLGQPRPNPAAGFARIAYQLPAKSHVSLRVYDLGGTVVRTLVEAVEESGFRTAAWDGRDDRGRQVASGIYFYKLEVLPEEGESQRLTAARKTVLLR